MYEFNKNILIYQWNYVIKNMFFYVNSFNSFDKVFLI